MTTNQQDKPKLKGSPLDEPVWIFPFEAMEVGESFFIPTMKPAYMTYAIENGAKRSRVKVKVYITTSDGMLGVRAWRTG